MPKLPQRERLFHLPPAWVQNDSLFFITVCCNVREKNQLNNRVVFSAIAKSISHYAESGKWHVESFLAMPDHWHALIAFHDLVQMEKVIRDWKRYIAKQTGVIWQDGFFEHRLRSRQSAEEKWHYILQNPVRKGFVTDPKDWPYIWLPASVGRADYP